jgi:TonB family protein
MLKNILLKFALLILSFGVLGAAELRAQTSSCALKLYNSDFQGTVIKNAAAAAVNIKTKRVYRSTLKDEAPYFAVLPEGEYEITVSKPGFKRSQDRYQVACEDAKEGVLSLSLWMEKGSSKQIFEQPKIKLGDINPGASGENSSIGEQVMPAPEERQPDALPRVRVGQKFVAKGIVNGIAISLPMPEYPRAAKAVRAEGTVHVQVTIDEEGNVISARAVAGHPLLQVTAVKAAREAKFRPTLLSGTPVKVTGIITYNFVTK